MGRGRGRERGQNCKSLSANRTRQACPPSCECLSVCWIKKPDKAPFPVRVPASAEEFLGGPSADEINFRRKRSRDSSELSSTSLQEVLGLEESKGEPFSPLSSQNTSINPSLSTYASPRPPSVFPTLEALRQYSILVDGARKDGPDYYIPCEWTPDLLLQDIPWSHLLLVCARGRPLDFVPTFHILKVRHAFIHYL